MAGINPFPAIWLGGVLFTISVVVAGYLTPGYSHFHQSISELGESCAPFARLVFWLGFTPLGTSFALYSIQTRDMFISDIPTVLFLLIGLAIVIAGVFPSDPQNQRDTRSGKIHARGVFCLLILLSIAPFVFSISALYQIPPADWFFGFSLSTGLFALVFLLVLPKGESQNTTLAWQNGLGDFLRLWYPMQGLHQRLLLSLYAMWWLVFSFILTEQP